MCQTSTANSIRRITNKDIYNKDASKKKVRSDIKAMLSRRGRNIQSIQSGTSSNVVGTSPAFESSSSVVYANLKESQNDNPHININ